MQDNKRKIIAVVGPTASGKSSLGIYLAQNLGGEVISADSRQVYKGLNLGTGKVTKKEMAGIPHHMLDVVSPKKQFTVDDFVKNAERAYSLIRTNKRIAVLVGGTGLYTDMLLGRMSYPAVEPNAKLRKQLEGKSVEQLFSLLKKLDPARAKSIDARNPRRLVRAIEIAKAVGHSPALNLSAGQSPYNVLWLGINPSDEQLKKNISLRLKARLKAGMVAEAKRLHEVGLSYKRMEALGLEYRYLSRLLQGKLTKNEFEAELEKETWQYAKRQRTWFMRNKDIRWVRGKMEALRLAKEFLSG